MFARTQHTPIHRELQELNKHEFTGSPYSRKHLQRQGNQHHLKKNQMYAFSLEGPNYKNLLLPHPRS